MSHLDRLNTETDFAAIEITKAWLKLAMYDTLGYTFDIVELI